MSGIYIRITVRFVTFVQPLASCGLFHFLSRFPPCVSFPPPPPFLQNDMNTAKGEQIIDGKPEIVHPAGGKLVFFTIAICGLLKQTLDQTKMIDRIVIFGRMRIKTVLDADFKSRIFFATAAKRASSSTKVQRHLVLSPYASTTSRMASPSLRTR